MSERIKKNLTGKRLVTNDILDKKGPIAVHNSRMST